MKKSQAEQDAADEAAEYESIAARLRAQATWVEGINYGRPASVMREAADRIEQERAERALRSQEWVEYTPTHKVWHYPNGSYFSIERTLLKPDEVGYQRSAD